MFGLGPWEIAIIAIVVVLLFGTKRLPELGSGLGKAISNFRQSYKEASAIDVSQNQESKQSTQQSGATKESSTQKEDK